MTVLKFPCESTRGRLATCGSATALLQMLACLRDCSPGSFASLPQLFNPCEGISTEDRESLMPRLVTALQAFLNRCHIPAKVRETSQDRPRPAATLGWLSIEQAAWQLEIPVLSEGNAVILELNSAELD